MIGLWAWTYFREVFRLGHDVCLILGGVGFVCCFAETRLRLGHVNWPHHHIILGSSSLLSKLHLQNMTNRLGLDVIGSNPIVGQTGRKPCFFLPA